METSFQKPVICPVLIDRVTELATLYTLIGKARSGRGLVTLLCSEAGVGKSRLVAETKAYASAQDFLLLQGNCFQTDLSCPYAPLLDLLRSCATLFTATISSDLAPFARELHQLLPDVVPLPPDPVLPSSLDPEQEKRRLFAALAQFFTDQAKRQPLLLVIEDIHWSDNISLEFLHYLARYRPTQSLLLLTYRSDEVHPGLKHFLAQLDRERLAQEISLAPLTQSEVNAMLRAIFALPRSARLELPESIYALTEGNPFFIEEILKSLLMAGDIFYENGRWERKSLSELHIPRSVQDAVQQRTDRLSAPAQRVLILSAVAGRRFDFALLQQLTKHEEQELLSLLKELIAAQLVVEESEERFAFRHALTRQAVYADLLVRERKALHRMIAETLERLYAPAFEAHLADLAYHFYEAGAWEKVLAYGQRAGEQVYRLYAPQAAIEQVTRALDAAQRGSIPPPASLYRLRGQAYETLGDFERARLDFETTLQMARVTSDRRAEWQALIDLGSLWAQRDYTQAGTHFQQALEQARHMDDPLTLAHSLNRLGNWHLNIEQPREALQYHQEALTLFKQLQDRHGLAETYDLLGMTAVLGGDLLQGTSYYRQAVELFQELKDRSGLTSSLATLAVLGGEYETDTMVPDPASYNECLRFGEQAIKIAREIGSRPAEIYALCALGQYLGPRGEYASALQLAREGLSLAEQIEHREWMTCAHWELGVLYLDLLALPEALSSLEHALILAHEVGSWNWIRIVSGFLARVLVLQQSLTLAESILSDALEPDAPMQTIGQRLVWAARAELALARSDPEQALDITNRLIESAANLSDEHVIPLLWKLRGEALAGLGRLEEAETILRAAQVAAQAQRLRPVQWRMCVSLGKLYQDQGRKGDTEQAFANARSSIAELASNVPDDQLRERFLSQATAMLPQKRALTPSRVAKEAFGGLTAREREVAALIAEEKSNREIAEVLVVSERTVESHVSNIMFKLGLRSRRQIRAWAREKGLVSQH
jgi:DNA-binding CsgD family transcriptional regulator